MKLKSMIFGVLKRMRRRSDPDNTLIERLIPRLSQGILPGPFDFSITLGDYSRGDFHDRTEMGILVHQMKDHHSRDAADRLIEFLGDILAANPLPEEPDLIVTVPDSITGRPFSPAMYMAEGIGRRFGWPVGADVILPVRREKPQRDRSFEERLRDTRPRYTIRTGEGVRHRHILLFDDIYASGQSLNEAAGLIREHHPRTVTALTLVRLRE